MGPALPNSVCEEELAFLERLVLCQLPRSMQTNGSIAGTMLLPVIFCRMVPGWLKTAVSLVPGNI